MKKIDGCIICHPLRWIFIKLLVVLMLVGSVSDLRAQGRVTVEGKIVDSNQEPLYGVTILVVGKPGVGVITDFDGNYRISLEPEDTQLEVSFLGMETQIIDVAGRSRIDIVLIDSSQMFEEVVIVGYGQQKRASVVGAITQTNAETLQRTGGVSSLGAALTGNLPGVITSQTSGMPGAEDPRIIIRTRSSWNNSDPLVLVDGIERPLNSVDISSVETVSVLKDASATAVYGVKGANGVILVTTKRGAKGKANIQVRGSMTAKVVSKLPEKYDAYDALMIRNRAIERELAVSPIGWADHRPVDIISKYRHPLNDAEWDRYPNVDWEKELFKSHAMSYQTSINVSGGTDFAQYFTAVDFVHEGDLFKSFDNNRGYDSGYGYNRINVRSNLDFNISKTTKFSTNLFGSNGVRKLPWNASDSDAAYWASAYRTSPDAMRPIYSDGSWGWYAPRNADVPNSVYLLALSGIEKRTSTQINTDFYLTQKLDIITKGLTARVNFSLDNSFRERGRGINDLYNNAQRIWVDPDNGDTHYETERNLGTQLDFAESIRWEIEGGNVDVGQTFRKMYYSGQFNYDRNFANHEVTGLALFSREQVARGSTFPSYREDWVFRTTYNYAMKYFFEFNGAYNGSEKFGPGYRFEFFPSISGGWTITEEQFMNDVSFVDLIKIRASWGRIGDDNVGGRWLYRDQWSFGGSAVFGTVPTNSIYPFYRISSLGNPNISWETVEKRNLGIDYGFIGGLITGSVDFFNDERTDILINGNQRAIPSYFGTTAPTANLGIVESQGYEIELRLNQVFGNGLRLWMNTSMTHAENTVKFRDEPQLLPAYQKNEDFPIGRTLSYIDYGFLRTWDDVYGSTERTTNNEHKLPGDFNIIDFNGDGVVDTYDRAPYGYTDVPENTFNLSLGLEKSGFKAYVQFYGVTDVTREVAFPTFHSTSNVVFKEGSYWNYIEGGEISLPRKTATVGPDANGTRYLYDGSFIRLRNAEVSYAFDRSKVGRFGMQTCRLYLSGSNLWFWTKMPDDRESNFGGNSSFGAYPTTKRFTFGIEITL